MSDSLTVWRVADGLSQELAYVEAETQTLALAKAGLELNDPLSAVIVYEE